MIRKIYHGSKDIIEKPRFGYGKKYNDYGLGFYCTDSLDMAKEWGVSESQNGYANCYSLDLEGFKIVDLNSPDYCILHWLSVLLENRQFDAPSGLAMEAKNYILRNFKVQYQDCDVMIGYRADDSYFSFAQDFINGTISYQQLNEAMHLGRLGQQIVLKSERAFEKIQFLGVETADYREWYEKKAKRDSKARRDYFSMDRNSWHRGDLYIVQILEEEIKQNDPRLR